ncbi:MAG: hypothetical protein HN981_04110 [Candidatus Pacebacteria bacterium]|nr:hypothetical protein [Candidatus Paceibacterota bacterium]MBT4652431.1 hypothetical protein [Candidatus Paceibacterota bacterium]MBT6756258.1 hypothetical protein [Candidatus Paceibacterota bacterium]MBT6921549.1 hypothetical protein [Candidatus Paceibacterota bacterium]
MLDTLKPIPEEAISKRRKLEIKRVAAEERITKIVGEYFESQQISRPSFHEAPEFGQDISAKIVTQRLKEKKEYVLEEIQVLTPCNLEAAETIFDEKMSSFRDALIAIQSPAIIGFSRLY